MLIAKLRNVEKFIKSKITLHTLWRIMKTHALDLSVRGGGGWTLKFALNLHKNVLENVHNMATLSPMLPFYGSLLQETMDNVNIHKSVLKVFWFFDNNHNQFNFTCFNLILQWCLKVCNTVLNNVK